MKRTEPTVSLLARKHDGTNAREYTPASHTDLKALFTRIAQERERAAFENGPHMSQLVSHSDEAQSDWWDRNLTVTQMRRAKP
jgi:hypothetical protein